MPLLLAACTTANAQRAYDETFAEIERTPLDEAQAKQALKAFAHVESASVTLTPVETQDGKVTARCVDLATPGYCQYRIWPYLYPVTYDTVRAQAEQARDAQQALDKQAQLDAEIAKDAETERQESAFRRRWSPLLGAGVDLGSTPGGMLFGAWARGGVRRFHGSFWSSGYALQLGGVDVPGAGAAFDAAIPLRLELDWFGDKRFAEDRGPLPIVAGYAFVAPSMLYGPKTGWGGGVRVGIGGQAIVADRYGKWPLLTELSFEQLYVQSKALPGVRFSIGLAL
jgi:hypothetical protein